MHATSHRSSAKGAECMLVAVCVRETVQFSSLCLQAEELFGA